MKEDKFYEILEVIQQVRERIDATIEETIELDVQLIRLKIEIERLRNET